MRLQFLDIVATFLPIMISGALADCWENKCTEYGLDSLACESACNDKGYSAHGRELYYSTWPPKANYCK
jgi:hypothetical protein